MTYILSPDDIYEFTYEDGDKTIKVQIKAKEMTADGQEVPEKE